MSTPQSNTPPRWFTVVSVLAIIWNVLGCMAYVAHVSMTPETIAALPEAERALYEASPVWVNGAFAIAVWGGLLGTVLLALRRKQAFPVLLVSLLGVLAQHAYSFGATGIVEVYGMQAIVMPLVVIIASNALVVLSRRADAQGWMR